MELLKDAEFYAGNIVALKQDGVNILLGDRKSGGFLHLRFCDNLPLFFLTEES